MPGIWDAYGQAYKQKTGRDFAFPSAYDADVRQADLYRAALEKAAYGDFGRQYGAGLGDITNFLARSGPLADSGAGTALRTKLASQLYGQAQSRIQGGYAQYLADLIRQRNQYNYQVQLMRAQKKMNKTGIGGFAGGVLGGVAGFLGGGPLGAVAGYQAGSRLGGGGGGGYYANDAYYG